MTTALKSFYHADTGTLTWVLHDPASRAALLVDPVLDFDMASGRLATTSAQQLLDYVEREGLDVKLIAETHAHADHVSAAKFLQSRLDAPIGIGAGIVKVQETFKTLFDLGAEFTPDGSQFARCFEDGDQLNIGGLEGRVLATPGHTSDSVSYVFDGLAFIGDTLFAPDFGTARCDFPGGDAHTLYNSIRRLYALPQDAELKLCHDYPPEAGAPRVSFTVQEQMDKNLHLKANTTEEEFVALRTARDAQLNVPKLLLPAIQMNIRAGELPPPRANGISYLRLPLNAL